MGRLNATGTRRLLRVLALAVMAISGLATWALATGPGGWDHLGDHGTPGTKSLNLSASALEATPSGLYVGGKFTDAGGIANADRIAKWNGNSWSAVSSSTEQITSGEVFAIAVADDKVYAGGTLRRGRPAPTTSRFGTGRAGSRSAPRPARRSATSRPCRLSGRPSTSGETSRTARASRPPTTCSLAT